MLRVVPARSASLFCAVCAWQIWEDKQLLVCINRIHVWIQAPPEQQLPGKRGHTLKHWLMKLITALNIYTTTRPVVKQCSGDLTHGRATVWNHPLHFPTLSTWIIPFVLSFLTGMRLLGNLPIWFHSNFGGSQIKFIIHCFIQNKFLMNF